MSLCRPTDLVGALSLCEFMSATDLMGALSLCEFVSAYRSDGCSEPV